jgi:thioredoxin 1
MKTKWTIALVLAVAAAAVAFTLVKPDGAKVGPEAAAPAASQPRPAVSRAADSPSPGRVTMIDLGADSCVPCKMMAPIIEELKREYAGRADIIFHDVWKDPAPAKQYGIRAIPTQIFFDRQGREVHRHVGFMDKKAIVEILTRLGVPPADPA